MKTTESTDIVIRVVKKALYETKAAINTDNRRDELKQSYYDPALRKEMLAKDRAAGVGQRPQDYPGAATDRAADRQRFRRGRDSFRRRRPKGGYQHVRTN